MDPVVGAAVQIALQTLIKTMQEKVDPLLNFDAQLKQLRESFLMTTDVLSQADMQHVMDRDVKRWLEQLEDVAYEADNVLDEFHYEILRTQVDSQNKLLPEVKNFFSRSNPLVLRKKWVHKIRDINKKLEDINHRAKNFGLHLKVSGGHPPGADASVARETDSLTLDPVVVGRENDVSRIVEMLSGSNGHRSSVLPIVGMGGVGKTTLVRLVFCDERIMTHFQKRIWVYASQDFDASVIFKKILESLKEEEVRLNSRDVVLRKLGQELEDKKYLLVLDDVWNEDTDKWDDFTSSLSGLSSVRGNSIVVTTRSERVASITKSTVYKLLDLSEEQCWSIIKAKAFGGQEVPIEFHSVGLDIAKRCQGLALAAKVVGGLLRNKSRDYWVSIQQNWLYSFAGDENTIMKILKLSFDNLPSPLLKKCFAYCSIFSTQLSRDEYIELWMAEGFLQTEEQRDMEAIGVKFFDLLLQTSLLQVVERDECGDIISCNMHDLVHDLASYVLGSRKARYIAFGSDKSCLFPKEQAEYVRTLRFEGQIPTKMYLDFRSLHTLILVGEDVKELPILIGTLIHLRLLDITRTRIETLPESICKLYHLQTLHAENCLKTLPDKLNCLISLRHLHVSNIELPPNMGKLESLRTLPHFNVGIKKGCGIAEHGSLKKLKGKIQICNLERVSGKDDAECANLYDKADLDKLKYVWNELKEGNRNDKDVMEGLQPHPNLKSLEICGFRGTSLPFWAKKIEGRGCDGKWMRFDNLVDVKLTSCQELQETPMLGHLPCLKFLYLSGLTNVKTLGSVFYGYEEYSWRTTDGVSKKKTEDQFPMLERLELSNMPNLIEWVEIRLPEVVAFPCLKHLDITNCSKLKSAPRHYPCLKDVKILGMASDLPLINICSGLRFLTKLTIRGVSGLIYLPEELFFNNESLSFLSVSDCPNMTDLIPSIGGGRTSLKELHIKHCHNLRKLPDDLCQLSSLEIMEIDSCKKLKSLPYPSDAQLQGFTSLRHLRIHICPVLATLPLEMVESFTPSIEYLSFLYCPSLSNLNMVLRRLKEMPHLTYLGIASVPKFRNLPMEVGSLRSLQHIVLGAFSNSFDLPAFDNALDNILRASQYIPSLGLIGREQWETLPNKFQNVITLTRLFLSNFGVESLPEWLGNLSSLKELRLRSCKKLRYLPSKAAMQRLTKLETLIIHECPLLELTEDEPRDSEWHKISHIPSLHLDNK